MLTTGRLIKMGMTVKKGGTRLCWRVMRMCTGLGGKVCLRIRVLAKRCCTTIMVSVGVENIGRRAADPR
jgi:hypothetical protein